MEIQIGKQQKDHHRNTVVSDGFKNRMKNLVLFNGVEFYFASLLIALMLSLAGMIKIVQVVANLRV
jgi:hypothetical protein